MFQAAFLCELVKWWDRDKTKMLFLLLLKIGARVRCSPAVRSENYKSQNASRLFREHLKTEWTNPYTESPSPANHQAPWRPEAEVALHLK